MTKSTTGEPKPKKGKTVPPSVTATVTAHDESLPITPSENIPTEPEQPSGETSPGVTMVVTMDITKDVAALSVDMNKVAISDMKKAYAGLQFKDLKDEANNNLIKTGHEKARKMRIAVEKRETFLKAPYISGSKKIGEVAKEYYFLLGEIENPLKEQLNLMKIAEAAEETKRMEELEREGTRRVEVLKEAGMKFGGALYEIGETISMDYASIKAMPIDEFEKFVIKVQNENERLADLAAKELEQLKIQRLQTREAMLESIGMIQYPQGGYIYVSALIDGVAVMKECLTDEPDDRFMTLFASLSGRIANAKKKIEDDNAKKAKERTVNMRSKLIIAAGLNRVDWIPGTTQTGFYFKNDFTECKMSLLEVEEMPDAEFDFILEKFENEITDAKAKELKKEADDKAAELLAKDRREQLVALGMTAAPKMACYLFNLPDATTQCSVAYGELTGQSAETWDVTVTNVGDIIARIKEEQKAFEDKTAKDKKDKEEKQAKDLLIFQERQYKLVNLGMVIVGAAFTVKNEFGDVATIAMDEVKATDEDVWPRRLTEVTADVERVKKLTTNKRNEALSKLEAAKPQAQKLKEYMMAILDIPEPVIEDPELSVIFTSLHESLIAALGKANTEVDRKINAKEVAA